LKGDGQDFVAYFKLPFRAAPDSIGFVVEAVVDGNAHAAA
jgi:hypothetical protein